MHDNMLVMAEWYDLFIPQRHHMQIMSYGEAKVLARMPIMMLAVFPVNMDLLLEQTPPQRASR